MKLCRQICNRDRNLDKAIAARPASGYGRVPCAAATAPSLTAASLPRRRSRVVATAASLPRRRYRAVAAAPRAAEPLPLRAVSPPRAVAAAAGRLPPQAGCRRDNRAASGRRLSRHRH
jgi:hypothetical protein